MPKTLTPERKRKVEHHLKQAALSLIEAQIEMLQDSAELMAWELSERLSPELLATYRAAEKAEAMVVTAQNFLSKVQ